MRMHVVAHFRRPERAGFFATALRATFFCPFRLGAVFIFFFGADFFTVFFLATFFAAGFFFSAVFFFTTTFFGAALGATGFRSSLCSMCAIRLSALPYLNHSICDSLKV